MEPLKPGDAAPDIVLPSSAGGEIRLSDFKGKKAVVLYFYPKDNTPICTRESCHFRDNYKGFKDLGAEVLGVSADGEESHKKFSAGHGLPFPLLSDVKGAAQKAFGVEPFLGLFPRRVTFVIDKEGLVRHVFSSSFRASKHMEEALAVLKTL